MTVEYSLLQSAIKPALEMLPRAWDTLPARVMILAIFGQEGDFQHRWQIIDRKNPMKKGPARGLPQMELGGGAITGIFNEKAFPSLSAIMRTFSNARGIGPTAADRYYGVEVDDIYAAGLARGLLYSDPKALPEVGQEEDAWRMYLRLWRPGAYDRGDEKVRADLRKKWKGYYARAVAAVQADAAAAL